MMVEMWSETVFQHTVLPTQLDYCTKSNLILNLTELADFLVESKVVKTKRLFHEPALYLKMFIKILCQIYKLSEIWVEENFFDDAEAMTRIRVGRWVKGKCVQKLYPSFQSPKSRMG